MTLQTFLPYLPFLSVLYALFAFVQALRHQRQGIVAVLLALLSFGVPFAAYVFVSDAAVRARLLQFMLINAGIVFAASLLTLLIERRNSKCDPNHSYGMLGLGLSVLLAVSMFVLPLALPSTTSSASNVTSAANTTANGQTVLVSDNTSNTAFNPPANTSAAQPEATQSADSASTTPTAVAQALTAQTGLSAADLLTKIQAGSTLADLISANKGDQTVVIPVIAKALDDLVAAGGMQAQMISNSGSDTTQVATQLVVGTLGQAQNFLLPQLISGSAPTPPSGNPHSGNFAPPSNTTSTDSTGSASNTNTTSNGGNNPAATTVAQDVTGSQVQGTAVATSEASPAANTVTTADATPIIRPTRISFPTATPVATEESTTESSVATGELASKAATCSLVIDYNLNLRTQPSTDGSTVLLSIPFGSTVTSDGKTSDGWYHVSYDNQTGWVKGDYVTAGSSCSALAVTQAS